jgi:predicted ribosomally synthesized peptide with SipW-like signal peptide
MKKIYKKFACLFSLAALIVWAVLGTGASLAWFTDTSDTLNNIFHVANFEVSLSHRTDEGKWEPVDGSTSVLDNNALYEPGYVQVVYLRVENTGDRAFDFHTAVRIMNYTEATNIYGQRFLLQDYIRFGVAVADSESEMEALVATRALAKEIANSKLQNYDTEVAPLAPGDVSYLALVIRMPEGIQNEANYRGDTVPTIELGIIVKADQQK